MTKHIGAYLLGVAMTMALTAAIALTRTNAPGHQASLGVTFSRAVLSYSREAQAPDRRPLSFYVNTARPNLFAALQQPSLDFAPSPAPIRVVREEPWAAPIVEPLPPPPDRFADYVYSGIVTMDGEVQALLENSKTKEGWYVKVGEAFEGTMVTDISSDHVTVLEDGKLRMFLMSTAFNVTPLTAHARVGSELPNNNIFTTGTFVHF